MLLGALVTVPPSPVASVLAMAPGSFLDPGNDGVDINDIALLIGVLVAIVGGLGGGSLVMWVNRRWVKKRDRERAEHAELAAARKAAEDAAREDRITAAVIAAVEARTAPIQPDANGGKSLPDAVARIGVLEAKFSIVEDLLRVLVARTDP